MKMEKGGSNTVTRFLHIRKQSRKMGTQNCFKSETERLLSLPKLLSSVQMLKNMIVNSENAVLLYNGLKKKSRLGDNDFALHIEFLEFDVSTDV